MVELFGLILYGPFVSTSYTGRWANLGYNVATKMVNRQELPEDIKYTSTDAESGQYSIEWGLSYCVGFLKALNEHRNKNEIPMETYIIDGEDDTKELSKTIIELFDSEISPGKLLAWKMFQDCCHGEQDGNINFAKSDKSKMMLSEAPHYVKNRVMKLYYQYELDLIERDLEIVELPQVESSTIGKSEVENGITNLTES